MAVRVVIQACGGLIEGKFASFERDKVHLYLGIKTGKKGGYQGCGKKLTFSAADVDVSADQPEVELRYAQPSRPRSVFARFRPAGS